MLIDWVWGVCGDAYALVLDAADTERYLEYDAIPSRYYDSTMLDACGAIPIDTGYVFTRAAQPRMPAAPAALADDTAYTKCKQWRERGAGGPPLEALQQLTTPERVQELLFKTRQRLWKHNRSRRATPERTALSQHLEQAIAILESKAR